MKCGEWLSYEYHSKFFKTAQNQTIKFIIFVSFLKTHILEFLLLFWETVYVNIDLCANFLNSILELSPFCFVSLPSELISGFSNLHIVHIQVFFL